METGVNPRPLIEMFFSQANKRFNFSPTGWSSVSQPGEHDSLNSGNKWKWSERINLRTIQRPWKRLLGCRLVAYFQVYIPLAVFLKTPFSSFLVTICWAFILSDLNEISTSSPWRRNVKLDYRGRSELKHDRREKETIYDFCFLIDIIVYCYSYVICYKLCHVRIFVSPFLEHWVSGRSEENWGWTSSCSRRLQKVNSIPVLLPKIPFILAGCHLDLFQLY